ncbi:hypothetical protein FEZ33_00500 [Ruoffia tabacinasalis]|uniref:Uncharacterized protein n=1 Tax=Ruoffia tabacinasalis TaxID=87458 RepID=A0A5R9EKJ1_9LACT|nr:hypothetical protein [Ruoffia tabacinasalis]TLQ49501.1 hypothetical protein FEZ33_00500 [Ruoffia tabacinasalis]
MSEEIKIRNVPTNVRNKLKEKYFNSNEKSFNSFMLVVLNNYAFQNELETSMSEYSDRQKVLIEIVNRNTQVINLIKNLSLEENEGNYIEN